MSKLKVHREDVRVHVDYDRDPDTSWLQQWDSAVKYYGAAPRCSHDYDMKYAGDHLWCGDHDECEEHATFDGRLPDGKERPGSGVMLRDDERVPFDDYIQGAGNPDNHVMIDTRLEVRCACCGSWSVKASLGNSDFLVDSVPDVGRFTLDEVGEWRRDPEAPEYYLTEVVDDLIAEAGIEFDEAKED